MVQGPDDTVQTGFLGVTGGAGGPGAGAPSGPGAGPGPGPGAGPGAGGPLDSGVFGRPDVGMSGGMDQWVTRQSWMLNPPLSPQRGPQEFNDAK